METANAVGDGKLTNEEMGIITRRLMEIIKRINGESITKEGVLKALQMIAEGHALKMTQPCQKKHCKEPLAFKMLPPAKRRKSKAPLRMRLESYKDRLYYRYKAFFSGYPTQDGKGLMHEDVIALMWEAENIPVRHINGGRVPVMTILDDTNPSERDRAVIASALQWLFTPVGRNFLDKVIATCDSVR